MAKGLLHDETLDTLPGSGIKVLQKAKGYRFSVDALLLAHFVQARPGETIAELGAGSAVISLLMARRWDRVAITGVEIQGGMVEMARRSVAINGLEGRITLLEGDVRRIDALFHARSFDVVVSNPPYRKADSGKINPVAEKALARHEIGGKTRDFIRAAAFLLVHSGRAYFIFPALRAVEILSEMRSAGIEPKRIQVMHSHRTSPGKLVLVEGFRGGKEGLTILAPLFLYDARGGYTPEIQEMLSGVSSPLPFSG